MSRTLEAVFIYITTGPATAIGHDGETFTNISIPVGTFIVVGKDGEWYIPRETSLIPENSKWIPDRRAGVIRLFRDYWRLAIPGGMGDKSPIAMSILNVPKKEVR